MDRQSYFAPKLFVSHVPTAASDHLINRERLLCGHPFIHGLEWKITTGPAVLDPHGPFLDRAASTAGRIVTLQQAIFPVSIFERLSRLEPHRYALTFGRK